MPNQYDRLFKENIEAMFSSLCRHHLGFEVQASENIPTKLQKTTEKEADFVKKITTTQGEQFIVHLEFQSQDDPTMLARMRDYHHRLNTLYGLKVEQYVFYMGDKPSKMKTQVEPDRIFKGFQLIELRQISYEQLLRTDIPEELLWAFFGDFGQDHPEAAITKIWQRLCELNPGQTALEKYKYQLMTLAGLRADYRPMVQQKLEEMGIFIDVENDHLYKEGEKKGLEKGLEKGLDQGLRQTVVRMLQNGFSQQDISLATGMTPAQIKAIKTD